jgi:4-carboxymuconolactone decarboxylase
MRPAITLISILAAAGAASAQAPLPADVYPETRNRLPSLGTDASGAVTSIRAHGTGRVVRWEFSHGRALSELAILTVARELDQPYEWSLHELEAVAVGLKPVVIDVVRNRLPLTALSETEAVIVELGRQILGEHELSAQTYSQAERLLGRADLVDIVSLMADYAATAVRLTAFNQHMPLGWRQFLPLPFEPPDDIYPDSRSRLPYIRDETPSASATPPLYARSLAPEGTGPGQIRRHGNGLETLEANVGIRLVRLASLVAARELDDQYQWTMNELAAAADGPEPAVVEVVRQRVPVIGLDEPDAALIELGRELLGSHTVSAGVYARARELFGQSDLVDFVALMARHARDSILLIAFDQQLPEGQGPLLPAR